MDDGNPDDDAWRDGVAEHIASMIVWIQACLAYCSFGNAMT